MARANLKLQADRDLLRLKLEKKRLQIRRAEDSARIAELNMKIKTSDLKKVSSSS